MTTDQKKCIDDSRRRWWAVAPPNHFEEDEMILVDGDRFQIIVARRPQLLGHRRKCQASHIMRRAVVLALEPLPLPACNSATDLSFPHGLYQIGDQDDI
jgi:hypothetical protein